MPPLWDAPGLFSLVRHPKSDIHIKVMDTKIIVETARATLAGTIPFPDVVSRLMATGVEYYHVDYVALRKTFYSGEGDSVVTTITYEGLPSVAADFDVGKLCAAILDSQRHAQPYRDFTQRAMEAGVQGYIAFLRGQRVTYWGRSGDQHTEWFPGADRPSQAKPRPLS
jgi:uncharacterized protein YbcV (DUF1398 family)